MNAKTAMNSGAIDANEDSISDTGPSWILTIAIETKLQKNEIKHE